MSLAERLRRLLVRCGGGVLRPVLVSCYGLVARGIGAYLRRGNAKAAVYATSSLATGELLPGVSDLDLAVVVPTAGPPGTARRALESRRDRLLRRVPGLARVAWVAVYEDGELARAQTPCLVQPAGRRGETLFFGAEPLADDLKLGSRPGFPGRVHTWRLLAGAERRGERRRRSPEEDRAAAWLELQSWWQWAVQGCLDPGTPGRASLCVKLVAEPCRILLWLEHGEELPTRRRVLERALELVPSERDAIADAIELRDRLARSPEPRLDRFLPAFVRLTGRVAAVLATELEPFGATPVRLDHGEPGELALGKRNLEQLDALGGGAAERLLPLLDWRGLVAPTIPDESFVLVNGEPGNPETLAAAAGATTPVVYAALRAPGILVLPAENVYWLGSHRSVHCAVSDPVSFALLEGASVARFPNHPGFSIADVAARAVAEHRAYLEVQLHEPGWEVRKLGVVLSAARAVLLTESVAAGEPLLPLTMAATARALGERLPGTRSLAAEAAGEYGRLRREGGAPDDLLVARLARAVSALAPYADDRAARTLRLRGEERRCTV
ncbi:MAG: hypothetical protein U0R69_09625 [Gaiellales bacterium]